MKMIIHVNRVIKNVQHALAQATLNALNVKIVYFLLVKTKLVNNVNQMNIMIHSNVLVVQKIAKHVLNMINVQVVKKINKRNIIENQSKNV